MKNSDIEFKREKGERESWLVQGQGIVNLKENLNFM